MIKIAPSILACDFANLEQEARAARDAQADMLHVDVMDGHFVPNITIGPCVVDSLHKKGILPLDVHLMVTDPLKYVEAFSRAGAERITFHVESSSDNLQTIQAIKQCGVKAAVSLKPDTPAEDVFPYLDEVAMVLVMTVEPGFGGQAFMADMVPKIAQIQQEIIKRGLSAEIQVDGGITPVTAKIVVDAGASILVAGSSIFGTDDYTDAVQKLRECSGQ